MDFGFIVGIVTDYKNALQAKWSAEDGAVAQARAKEDDDRAAARAAEIGKVNAAIEQLQQAAATPVGEPAAGTVG